MFSNGHTDNVKDINFPLLQSPKIFQHIFQDKILRKDKQTIIIQHRNAEAVESAEVLRKERGQLLNHLDIFNPLMPKLE